MFSLERNYIKEQSILLNKFKHKLKESEEMLHDAHEKLNESHRETEALRASIQDLQADRQLIVKQVEGAHESSTVELEALKQSIEMLQSDINALSELIKKQATEQKEFQEEASDEGDVDLLVPEDFVEDESTDVFLSQNTEAQEAHTMQASTTLQAPQVIDANPCYELLFSKDILSHLESLNPEKYYGGVRVSLSLLSVQLYATGNLKTLAAGSLLRLYNKVFHQLLFCVTQHQGTVNGYTGDSLLACFGMFDEDAQGKASNALAALYAIQKKLTLINAYLSENALDPLELGMALHLGMALCGKVGVLRPHSMLVLGNAVECVRWLSYLSAQESFVPYCSKAFVDVLEDVPAFGDSMYVDIPGEEPLLVYRLEL